MAPRVVAVLWLVLGIAIWNAFFDLYVSRGAREYLQKQLEFEAGRGPEPSMAAVMRQSTRDGLVMSTVWAALVVGGGLVTLKSARSENQPTARTPKATGP